MISTDHGSLEETAESGQLHLERRSFAEAEAAFGHVLDRLTSSSHPHGDRLRMTSLVGLAEIRARRCRDVIHDDDDDVDEWLRRMLSVLALYKAAEEIARTKTGVIKDRPWNSSGTGNDRRTIDNDVRYFEEVLQKSSVQAEVLENELVEVVKREVTSRGTGSRGKPDFGSSSKWLQKLVDRCCIAGLRHEDNEAATDNRDNGLRQQTTTTETTDQDNGRRQQTKTTVKDNRDNGPRQPPKTTDNRGNGPSQRQTKTTDQDKRDNGRRQTKTAIETTDQDNRDNRDNRNEEYTLVSTTTVEDKTMLESWTSQVPVLKRRIDYGRLQEGIRSIVDGVSGEVRSQYRHFKRRIPGQAMQTRLFNELVLRLSPGYRENDDLAGVLEEAVRYEDCSAVTACEDVESRRKISEEILLRIASKNWKEEEEEEEDVEELESSEWGECWEKEEKVRRDDIDKEKEEEDEDEEEENVETTELRVLSSAAHSTKAVAMQKNYLGVTSYEGSAALDVNRRSLLGSSTTSDTGTVGSRTVQSRIQTPDFKTGNSLGSGAVGPSGRILTLWRSTGSNRVKVESANRPRNGPKERHGFEEISPLTDRDKVLGWLASVQPEPTSKPSSRDRISGPTTTHPSGDRVGQVVGHVILRAGDSFRKEKAYFQAHEMYRSAMGLFQRFPLPQGHAQFVADLLLKVGAVKCSMGKVETGSRMMEESVDVMGEEADALKVAELWFQVGNAYLAERMRRESLQARVMQLVREELEGTEERQGQCQGQDKGQGQRQGQVQGQEQGVDDDESSECDSSSSSSSECHSYCVCIYEAMNSYRKALSSLDPILAAETRVPELVIGIASNMADCYVMTGNLDRAEAGYERALRLFPSAALGSRLLAANAHVLSMLGTVSFLARNRVRAATMYETSSILAQNHEDADEEMTLEAVWTAAMVGLSHAVLSHPDRAEVWCVRAFAGYTRFFRGQILDVDPLNRWYIVRTLYVLGTGLGAGDKALYYLNLARNVTTSGSEGDDGDLRHLIKVLTAIGDVYRALNVPEKARTYYEEALEYGKGIEGYGNKYGDDLEEVFHRQDDDRDDTVAALLTLGTASTMTCDLDEAIDYYSDIVDAFGDAIGARHDVAGVMASLGTLCHVKDYMHDDANEGYLNRAERYFEEAFRLTGSTSPVCIRYANFLYRRGRYADALTVMLPYVFCSRPADDKVFYSGVEQVVLPDHLHHVENEDTLVLEARVFASFLATLCYNCLGLNDDADDALIQLYRLVVPSAQPLDHIMLGYGLMERGLFEEAAGSFAVAAGLQSTPGGGRTTYDNASLCFMLFAYLTVARAVDSLLEFVYQRSSTKDQYSPTFDGQRRYLCAVGASAPRGAVAARGAARFTDVETRKAEEVAVEQNTLPGIIPNSEPNRNCDLKSPLVQSAVEAKEEEDGEEEEKGEEWEEWTTEEIVVVKCSPQIPNLVANGANRNRTLDGTAYQRYDYARSVPESTDGGVPDRTDATASVNRAEVVAEKTGRSKPEVDVDDPPEVNGSSKDADSTDEWIVTEEETVDTPEEILVLLRRTYSGLDINK